MGKKRRRGREFVGQRNGVVRGALRLLVLLVRPNSLLLRDPPFSDARRLLCWCSLLSSLFSRKRVEQQLTGVHLVPYIKTVIWHLPKFGVLKFCHVQALTWHQYILFVAHSSCSAACTLQGTQGRCMKCTGITVYVLLWFSLCPKKAKLADKDENLGWEMVRI